MSRRAVPLSEGRSHTVPPGAPSWITPELIRDTIETWQAHYGKALTGQDALEIICARVRIRGSVVSEGGHRQ
jgi:hypothetical protein